MARRIITFLFCLLLAAPATAAELSGTLEKVAESGRLAIGHREASYPFSYLSQQGQPTGYSIDLCLRVAAAVQSELGLSEMAIDYVPVTPDDRMARLLDGTIDIECGSTTNTLTRQEQVDFSHIICVTGAKLLVKANRGIHDFGDLEGKRLALASDTTTEAGVKSVIERLGLEVVVVAVQDHDEGFEALEADEVDCYISDHILLHGLRQRAEKPDDYLVVGEFLSYEPYALMLRRDDADFRLLVNRTLSELFRTDEIELIYRDWFEPMGARPGHLLRAAVRLQALPK